MNFWTSTKQNPQRINTARKSSCFHLCLGLARPTIGVHNRVVSTITLETWVCTDFVAVPTFRRWTFRHRKRPLNLDLHAFPLLPKPSPSLHHTGSSHTSPNYIRTSSRPSPMLDHSRQRQCLDLVQIEKQTTQDLDIGALSQRKSRPPRDFAHTLRYVLLCTIHRLKLRGRGVARSRTHSRRRLCGWPLCADGYYPLQHCYCASLVLANSDDACPPRMKTLLHRSGGRGGIRREWEGRGGVRGRCKCRWRLAA
ncbi:hypothetical protein C8F01DRAFT_743994 [Mycena amicta]|nr:hypothetical protein C8F01DRAFT_743994 [Mycena amicta]